MRATPMHSNKEHPDVLMLSQVCITNLVKRLYRVQETGPVAGNVNINRRITALLVVL